MTLYEINILRSELERIAEATEAISIAFREIKAVVDEGARNLKEATELMMVGGRK